jgi:hypothetical protein
MPDTLTLSADALALIKLHLARRGDIPVGDIPVDDSTREPYRELARAGLMIASHTFVGGREARYRFTDAGWKFASLPSLEESA